MSSPTRTKQLNSTEKKAVKQGVVSAWSSKTVPMALSQAAAGPRLTSQSLHRITVEAECPPLKHRAMQMQACSSQDAYAAASFRVMLVDPCGASRTPGGRCKAEGGCEPSMKGAQSGATSAGQGALGRRCNGMSPCSSGSSNRRKLSAVSCWALSDRECFQQQMVLRSVSNGSSERLQERLGNSGKEALGLSRRRLRMQTWFDCTFWEKRSSRL